jgi:hypothetical protein
LFRHLFLQIGAANIAGIRRRRRRSQRKERLRSLLLRAVARDFPDARSSEFELLAQSRCIRLLASLAAMFAWKPPPYSDARSYR